jgi:hypothetical protein
MHYNAVALKITACAEDCAGGSSEDRKIGLSLKNLARLEESGTAPGKFGAPLSALCK